MLYELHVTVEERPTLEQAVAFSTVCEEMLGKSLLIQLANGNHPLQLMIARRSEFDDSAYPDSKAVTWAEVQAGLIEKLDWKIMRIKVEAPFAARSYGPKLEAVYNEAHYKMYLEEDEKAKLRAWLDRNPELMFKHSWNVMQEGINYLTVRSTNPDVREVQKLFMDRELQLGFAGFVPEKSHFERVVYDSNLALDDGWNL